MSVSVSKDRPVCLCGRHPLHTEWRGSEIDVIRKRRALLREINELIREPGAESYLLVCECENADCLGRLQVAAPVYEELRDDHERFLVIAGHEDDDVERLVAADGYMIVRRRSAQQIPSR